MQHFRVVLLFYKWVTTPILLTYNILVLELDLVCIYCSEISVTYYLAYLLEKLNKNYMFYFSGRNITDLKTSQNGYLSDLPYDWQI